MQLNAAQFGIPNLGRIESTSLVERRGVLSAKHAITPSLTLAANERFITFWHVPQICAHVLGDTGLTSIVLKSPTLLTDSRESQPIAVVWQRESADKLAQGKSTLSHIDISADWGET